MASRPRGYGFSGEVARKIQAKYDIALEQEARLWIEAVLGEPIAPGEDPNQPLGQEKFQLALKDGTILCKLLNTIQPNSVKKINQTKLAFMQMENTGQFLDGCVRLGIAKNDLFQTADLFDRTNMVQVINGIYALGRKAQKLDFNGPTLGAREADANPRNFSQEKLNAGNAVIGLQMGTNKGASQAGMTFGRSRSINEHGATNGVTDH